MQYADTCLLVSLFLRDSGTDAALTWLDESSNQPIMASHWSLTEFSSAAAMRVRKGDISARLHKEVLTRFRRFAQARLTLEPLQPGDFERAAAMTDIYASGLRAADALHLALCVRLSSTLCSADRIMIIAAEACGVSARRIS